MPCHCLVLRSGREGALYESSAITHQYLPSHGPVTPAWAFNERATLQPHK